MQQRLHHAQVSVATADVQSGLSVLFRRVHIRSTFDEHLRTPFTLTHARRDVQRRLLVWSAFNFNLTAQKQVQCEVSPCIS